jgi:hypothetical protein
MRATEPTASAMPTHSTLNAPDTNHATRFDYSQETDGYWDSSSDWYRTTKYSYWQHLAEINRGRKRGGKYWNSPFHTYQANRDLIDAVGTQLNLLSRQKQDAQAWFAHLDLDEWGLRVELVACCLCARIVHEDDSDERRTHPNVAADHEDKPIEFVEIPARFGFREKEVISMYGKLDSYLRDNDQPDPRKFDRRQTDERNPTRRATPGDEC